MTEDPIKMTALSGFQLDSVEFMPQQAKVSVELKNCVKIIFKLDFKAGNYIRAILLLHDFKILIKHAGKND